MAIEKVKEYFKKYGIENKRLNNMPIGFNRKEIELLVKKLKEEEGSI